jgi:hypothetical protein
MSTLMQKKFKIRVVDNVFVDHHLVGPAGVDEKNKLFITPSAPFYKR